MIDQRGIAFIPVLIWTAVILLTGTVAVDKELIKVDLSGNGPLVQKVDVAPTPSPSENPTPDPTYIPTPTPKKAQAVYVDPDPVITCTSSAPNCSGQSIKVKQSACSKITCCQVGDKWSVYPSSDKCTQDQQNYRTNQRTGISGQNYPSAASKNNPEAYLKEPIVDCVLSYGTYRLYKSDCDQDKINDQNLQTATRNNVTTPVVSGVDHQKLQQDCINQENKLFNDLTSSINNTYGDQPFGASGIIGQQHSINLGECLKL